MTKQVTMHNLTGRNYVPHCPHTFEYSFINVSPSVIRMNTLFIQFVTYLRSQLAQQQNSGAAKLVSIVRQMVYNLFQLSVAIL